MEENINLILLWQWNGSLAKMTKQSLLVPEEMIAHSYLPGSITHKISKEVKYNAMWDATRMFTCQAEMVQNEGIVEMMGSPDGDEANDFMDKEGDFDHQG
jgi:hypothetical protein